MDIGKLSLAELRRLQSKVESEIRRRSDTARRNLLKRVQKMAAEEGLSLNDVFGNTGDTPEKGTRRKNTTSAKKVTKTRSVAIKYRNPNDPSTGWSGRGRKPQWVLDWVGQGKSLDDLAV